MIQQQLRDQNRSRREECPEDSSSIPVEKEKDNTPIPIQRIAHGATHTVLVTLSSKKQNAINQNFCWEKWRLSSLPPQANVKQSNLDSAYMENVSKEGEVIFHTASVISVSDSSVG